MRSPLRWPLLIASVVLAFALSACAVPGPPANPVAASATSAGPAANGPTAANAPGKSFAKAEQVVDPARQYTATFKTDKGEFVFALFADKSPRTVNSFVFLAQNGFYDGLTFHRLEPGFVIQGGDPLANGSGTPGYSVEEDKNDGTNVRGAVSMAKAAGSTAVGSQFFINLGNNPGLDADSGAQKRFYPFASVISGMEVVDALRKGDVIRSVTIGVK